MIEIAYFSLLVIIIVFVINLYLLFTSEDRDESMQQGFAKWKISLILFSIALIFFILYSVSMANTLQQSTVITDSSDGTTFTVKNNDYLDAISFSILINGLLLTNFILLVAQVVTHFRIFYSRGRMKKKSFGRG